MTRETTILAFPGGVAEILDAAPEPAVEPAEESLTLAEIGTPGVLVFDCLDAAGDLQTQMLAGEYVYRGPVIVDDDLAKIVRPGRVIIEHQYGFVIADGLAEDVDLFDLLGYGAYDGVPSDLVLTVGDRTAITWVMREVDYGWAGDHVTVAKGDTTTMIAILIQGLRILAAVNDDRVKRDLPRRTWHDLFPAIRNRVIVEIDGH